MKSTIARMVLIAAIAEWAGTAGAADDWSRVGEALGKSGKLLSGGIYKIALPRSDLKVTLDGVEIKPGLALGGWLAFAKEGAQSMVMGDLVLTEDEVNPVMTKVLAGGLTVTALHNHLLRNRPFTMYLHVHGIGDPVKLASVLHDALAASKTRLAAGSPVPGAPAIGDKVERETRFYITSLVLLASLLAPIVRGHWAIENSLHWVMDMIFRDDECRVRTDHAPANFCTIKHMAQNLIRMAPGKSSLRLKRKTAGWDDDFLASLLTQ